MSLFHRKRLAHQLVASQTDQGIMYTCTICSLDFYSLADASWKYNREWCPGKRCYTEANLNLFRTNEDVIPAYLIRGDELKQERRKLRKGQEPLAYLCYTLVRAYHYSGGIWGNKPLPQEYIPLYDVRECIALDGAIALPAFEE